MKTLWFVLLVVSMLAKPAWAQEVTLAELEGAIVKSRVFRAQTVRVGGKESSGRVQSDVEVIIGPGDLVRGKQTSTWHRPNGTTRTTVARGSARIGKPKATVDSGGGYGVAVFLDSTLTYMRTFKKGAFKFTFKFARTPRGLTCTSRETYLRERGANVILRASRHDKRPVVVVRDKQISSTCRVTKRR